MPAQDTSQIKNKIILTLQRRGPSLPVHIARETGLSMLFASAFLSELLSEGKIKISNMKVGNSPIYFINGQEPSLEKFSHHLKSKEKEAFSKLKEKKILKDKKQEPAIRVALRTIKDFAIPFEKDREIFWKYFIHNEKERLEEVNSKEKEEKQQEIKKDIQEKANTKEENKEERDNIERKEYPKENLQEDNKELNIFEKKENKKKKTKKKTTKRKSKKGNERFFNKVKEFLSEKNIQIIDIESFNKEEVILKIRENEKEKFLVAYNKKRITDFDLIKAYRKVGDREIPYMILSLGDLTKKLTDLIESIKNLSKIEKITK